MGPYPSLVSFRWLIDSEEKTLIVIHWIPTDEPTGLQWNVLWQFLSFIYYILINLPPALLLSISFIPILSTDSCLLFILWQIIYSQAHLCAFGYLLMIYLSGRYSGSHIDIAYCYCSWLLNIAICWDIIHLVACYRETRNKLSPFC